MTLKDFLLNNGISIASLQRRCDPWVSYQTCHAAVHGKPMVTYAKAETISRATGGVVTVDDLCKPNLSRTLDRFRDKV